MPDRRGDELELRWEAERAEQCDHSRLHLFELADSDEARPEALRALCWMSDGARLGGVELLPASRCRPQQAVDCLGERIDDRERTRIGIGGEDSILLDTEGGDAIIYRFTCFKCRWASGTLLTCSDVAESVNTVAPRPRYAEIRGPVDEQQAGGGLRALCITASREPGSSTAAHRERCS